MSRWLVLWVVGAAVGASGTVVLAAEPGRSEWVYPGADGRLVYKRTEAGDRILDFSYAGYMGGGVALPDVAVKRTVEPSGGEDDSGVIQKAIDEVAGLPVEGGFRGAVLLGPGVFHCPRTITVSASGVVLRGSGASGEKRTTIKLVGRPHLGIAVRSGRARETASEEGKVAATSIADAYVPSGAVSFSVADASGFAVGDVISIRKPVTEAWVKFMAMDDLVRDGRKQTWIRVGETRNHERRVAAISGKVISVDVPLADSFDEKYLNPPGTAVVKVCTAGQVGAGRVSQCGVEDLHIESPLQEIGHSQPHFSALRMNGEDCWARDVVIDETMNSVGVGGRRISLVRVSVNRKAKHQGSSKPAEFAPNGTQVLLDRCAVNADNVWFAATGAGVSGPIVLLNCTFNGVGRAESHQRWSTGMLYDNVRAPHGGIDFRDRGSMGSGHGWSMGWGVAWNCEAREYVIQNPPGAMNWMIGCVGKSVAMPRPFAKEPMVGEGTIDSPGRRVEPGSLYLAQLGERLGGGAVKNIGY